VIVMITQTMNWKRSAGDAALRLAEEVLESRPYLIREGCLRERRETRLHRGGLLRDRIGTCSFENVLGTCPVRVERSPITTVQSRIRTRAPRPLSPDSSIAMNTRGKNSSTV